MGTLFYEIRTDEAYIGEICDHPFPLHVHDVVEIVCVTTGMQKMTIAGKQHTLKCGDIAVIFPAIPHSYDFVSQDAAGVTLIFSPDIIVRISPANSSKINPASIHRCLLLEDFHIIFPS